MLFAAKVLDNRYNSSEGYFKPKGFRVIDVNKNLGFARLCTTGNKIDLFDI